MNGSIVFQYTNNVATTLEVCTSRTRATSTSQRQLRPRPRPSSILHYTVPTILFLLSDITVL